MTGNSQRRGATRKPGSKKGPTGGTGGKGRQALEGRGPTPKAEERPYHVAAKRKHGIVAEEDLAQRPCSHGIECHVAAGKAEDTTARIDIARDQVARGGKVDVAQRGCRSGADRTVRCDKRNMIFALRHRTDDPGRKIANVDVAVAGANFDRIAGADVAGADVAIDRFNVDIFGGNGR